MDAQKPYSQLQRLLVKLSGLLLLPLSALADVALEVPGADDRLRQNLLDRLRLNAESCDAPRWRIRRLFARAESDLESGLHAFGYYTAGIKKDLQFDDACWQVHITINLGSRVSVRQRSVVVHGEAADDEALQSLLSDLPLAQGTPLDHGEYEDIKRRLRDLAAQRGYLDFSFTRQQLRIYPDQVAAEIDIEADSGPRYRFGELHFSEQPLDGEFVRRLADVRRGEAYDTRRLTGINRHLSDTGYFQRVEVRPRRDERVDREVPVDITLEPAARHAWRTGIGFATDTGPRVSLGYENRYVTSSGHRLQSGLRLSPVESRLQTDYKIPGQEPHRENFSFGAKLMYEDTDSAESDSLTLAARHELKAGGWTQSRFVELLYEESEVGDDTDNYTLLMPGVGVDRVQADDFLRTRRGYRLHFEVRGAYEGLVSTATLLQLRGSAKGIHRFGDGGRITGRVDAGATLGDSVTALPATLRFFAGGDNSVRGYKYKSLGPEDSDGEPLGGRNLLTGSIEYEHPISGDDWWLGAFVDGGNAFDTDRIEVEYGYGAGVRWYSPVGRLRLDLALPGDTSSDDWRIHFGLGADL